MMDKIKFLLILLLSVLVASAAGRSAQITTDYSMPSDDYSSNSSAKVMMEQDFAAFSRWHREEDVLPLTTSFKERPSPNFHLTFKVDIFLNPFFIVSPMQSVVNTFY
jgi:hypothetical protein